jgi:ABC-type uncharacterized transport system ATPase subunit
VIGDGLSPRVAGASEPIAAVEGGEAPSVVEMSGITKRFGPVVANDAIDLDLRPGEVHALLGENGAGKTTLMNILSGIYRADEGTILVDGEPVLMRTPAQALALGIGMVHQHFRLVENFTAAENVHLGWHETARRLTIEELARRTEQVGEHYGLPVDPLARVWQLSVGEQQRVEILRVLARGARVLILDEPTAVLTPAEAGGLFSVMRSLAAVGKTVVFISHKLEEVLQASLRVTVLRGGRKMVTLPRSECDHRTLARLMMGQELVFRAGRKELPPGRVILEMVGAHASSDRSIAALRGIDLSVREGEVVGVAGVAGNGQRELAESLTGIRPLTAGSLTIDARDMRNRSPQEFARAGVGHIPEDRTGEGLVGIASVTKNAILREYVRPPISGKFRLRIREADRFARRLLEETHVAIPTPRLPVRYLSGGNQQRLVAGRETRVAFRLLVAVHPTRGLDVGATDRIRQVLLDQRNRGGGVLLISEDLDELLLVSDRIVVLYEGRIVGEFVSEGANREEIGLLMGGGAV